MNLFGDSDYLEKLSLKGDPLERLEKAVDFECFRPTLNRIFKYDLKNKSHGGRPPYDLVLMLKILILQRLYNLSDDAMEYQMIDRISFRRFLKIDDKVPDAKTIWNFRNQLSKSNRGNWLFSAFQEKLESQGMIAHKGQIVDATFIEAPKQRNPKDENELIKANRVPVNWTKNKRAQKDTAARWTIKGNERHYGYKNHIAIDTKSKFVKNYQTTPANVHDSQVIGVLVDPDEITLADSAYQNQATPKGAELFTCLKNTRSKSLKADDKMFNKIISKIRVRIEHVFGFVENSMHGSSLRSIGFDRAVLNTDLTNLTYNLLRYEQVKRLNLKTWR